MSTRRKGRWGPNGTGPTGKKLCYCGCGKEVTPPLRTSHSPQCYSEWAKRNDPATVRRLVYARDRGICACCSIDTETKQRERETTRPLIYWLAYRYARELREKGELPPWAGTSGAYDYLWAQRWTDEEMERRFGKQKSTHCWEADHIIPVIEGGGECGLENYRTLCIPCHHKATAALAARRAQKRKAEKSFASS